MNEACSDARDDSASKARRQAFNATQWLARLTNSYNAQGDELELQWDDNGRRFLTPDLAPGLALGLSLQTLTLQFDENGKPSPHPIDLDGKSSTELEAWVLVELLHRGVDRDVFSKVLPYQATGLMSGEEPKFSPRELADELTKLNETFRAAAEILLSVRQKLRPSNKGGTDDSDVARDLIVWPRRMEIGFWDEDVGPADRRFKLGFAAGGANEGAPRYFFANGAKRPIELSLVEAQKMSVGEVTDYLAGRAGILHRSETI